ncbi:MAG TPA: VCBS repeat-containing protein, partial [Polyangiaceae bacterium]|nr:VCBS repeat-containing protein [Polyangiaceae bacterium]
MGAASAMGAERASAGRASDVGPGGAASPPDAPDRGQNEGGDPTSGASGGVAGSSSGPGGAGASQTDAGETTPCAESAWRDVELLERTDGALSASTIARQLAAYRDTQSGSWCSGVLVTPELLGAIDCPVKTAEVVSFQRQRATSPASPWGIAFTIEDTSDSAPGIRLAKLAPTDWVQHPIVTWRRQPRFLDERLTLIARDADGFAVARHIDACDVKVVARDVAWPLTMTVPAFGDDGSLLAFCALDRCGEPGHCATLASALKTSSELNAVHAMSGVRYADVDGDEASDAVVFNSDGVFERTSDARGQVFGTTLRFSTDVLLGTADFLADVDGDGLADAVFIAADGVHVGISTGAAFRAQTRWTDASLDATNDWQAADVDGSAGQDLVALAGDAIVVHRARQDRFVAEEIWAKGVPAGTELRLADVDGDGRADAILLGARGLDVLRSTGNDFAAPSSWLEARRPGAPGWLFADVDGDGRADAVAVDAHGSYVFTSDGQSFAQR